MNISDILQTVHKNPALAAAKEAPNAEIIGIVFASVISAIVLVALIVVDLQSIKMAISLFQENKRQLMSRNWVILDHTFSVVVISIPAFEFYLGTLLYFCSYCRQLITIVLTQFNRLSLNILLKLQLNFQLKLWETIRITHIETVLTAAGVILRVLLE